MAYKTSKNYDRLIELLDKKKNVLVIVGTSSFFASIDEWKGYYIGHSWLNHGIEFSLFASKSAEEFAAFCRERGLEFLEPDDCTGCVQPGSEGRTQTALRTAGRTQLWHDRMEEPRVPTGHHNVRIVLINEADGYRSLDTARFYPVDAWSLMVAERKIMKWAYFNELEAL